MSNYYFKKERTFRSRKKGESRADNVQATLDKNEKKPFYSSVLHMKEQFGTVERFKRGGHSRKNNAKVLNFGNGLGNLLSLILILLIVIFLFFFFFMRRPHVVFRGLMRNFVKEQLSALDYMGKEGDFSKSFILKASSDNENLDYLLRNSWFRLDLDTLSKTKISKFYLNYLGQDVVDLTTTYNNGKLGLQSMSSSENDYYTTDIDRFITAVTNEDLDVKTYLGTKFGNSSKKKLFAKYSNLLLSLVNAENINVSKKREIILDSLDSSFKGKMYTFKPSAKEIEKMLLELGNTIRKDEELRKMLKSSGMEMDLLTSYSYNIQGVKELARTKDVDVLVSDFSNYLVDNAKSIANELETGGFTCEIGVNSKKIGYMHISFDDSLGFSKSFVFESIEKDKKQYQTYILSDEGNSTVISLKNAFLAEKGQMKGDMDLSLNGSIGLTLDYDFDKNKKTIFLPEGEYQLSSSLLGLNTNLHIAKFSDKQTEYKLALNEMDEAKLGIGNWSIELTEEDIKKLDVQTSPAKDMDMMSNSEYMEVLDSLEKSMTNRILVLMGYQANP